MMQKRFSLVDAQMMKPLFSLVLFCGLALILSIPPGRQVKDFGSLASLQRQGMYFYVYVFFSGMLGLSLGTLAAVQQEAGRALYVHLLARIALGQALLVPYFIFMRALYPGREGMLVLVVLYATLVAFLMSVASRLIEESGHGASPRGFLGKYAVFVIYFAAPLLVIPALSPLGFVSYLLSGQRVWMILLGYGIPLGLTLTGIVLCERYLGRAR